MTHLLLAIIYLAFISLGLPDALLGSAWPTMYPEFNVPISYAGLISMIIAVGTVISSLMSDRLTRRFSSGKIAAVSVAMTAAAMLGFSLSHSFWLLCFWAIPYGLGALGLIQNPDAAVIGTVMVLIPGLLFTNAMRDIIFGDTNSGVNRIIQVLLIAIAIACGTGVAWFIASQLWGAPVSVAMADHNLLIQCLACGCGAVGFCFLFNIHNLGIAFCATGGVLTWIVHCISIMLGAAELPAVLIASIFAAIYAEVMARRRKCPAIGYLILGLISLIPGASLYYTISHIIKGEMAAFADRGLKTIAIAGLMAAGILLVSTSVRMINEGKKHRMEKKKKLP